MAQASCIFGASAKPHLWSLLEFVTSLYFSLSLSLSAYSIYLESAISNYTEDLAVLPERTRPEMQMFYAFVMLSSMLRGGHMGFDRCTHV